MPLFGAFRIFVYAGVGGDNVMQSADGRMAAGRGDGMRTCGQDKQSKGKQGKQDKASKARARQPREDMAVVQGR